jgi:hypothetical protein
MGARCDICDVSASYPYPNGFVIGTVSGDDDVSIASY